MGGFLRPILGGPGSVGLGWGPRHCISDQFLGDADALAPLDHI